jgi:hypothetical protein
MQNHQIRYLFCLRINPIKKFVGKFSMKLGIHLACIANFVEIGLIILYHFISQYITGALPLVVIIYFSFFCFGLVLLLYSTYNHGFTHVYWGNNIFQIYTIMNIFAGVTHGLLLGFNYIEVSKEEGKSKPTDWKSKQQFFISYFVVYGVVIFQNLLFSLVTFSYAKKLQRYNLVLRQRKKLKLQKTLDQINNLNEGLNDSSIDNNLQRGVSKGNLFSSGDKSIVIENNKIVDTSQY